MDEPKPDDLKVISEKLEVINLQFAKRKEARRKIFHWGFNLIVCVDRNCFCGYIFAEQSILGVELQ